MGRSGCEVYDSRVIVHHMVQNKHVMRRPRMGQGKNQRPYPIFFTQVVVLFSHHLYFGLLGRRCGFGFACHICHRRVDQRSDFRRRRRLCRDSLESLTPHPASVRNGGCLLTNWCDAHRNSHHCAPSDTSQHGTVVDEPKENKTRS